MSDGETRIYENAGVGVRFEIDARFAPGSGSPPSPGLGLDNVRTACLAFIDAGGGSHVLSIAAVEVLSETSPLELADQLVIHNRYAALTARQEGWTIHRPWEPASVAGQLAMRNDYVVPRSARPDEPGAERVTAWGRATSRATSST